MGNVDLGSCTAAFPPAGRRYYKYNALGNDYIVLDPVDWPEPPTEGAIRRICDRHRGVGSDGILWVRTSPPAPLLAGGESDRDRFALRLFNPDGGEFEKSGNGLRIFARYCLGPLPAGWPGLRHPDARRPRDSPRAGYPGRAHRDGYGTALVPQHRHRHRWSRARWSERRSGLQA